MGQVPPPIMIGLDETWDTKGSHGHVNIYHPGADSYNYFCSIKTCFCQSVIQPKIAFISWVTGKGITYFEKNPTNMMCYCSEK